MPYASNWRKRVKKYSVIVSVYNEEASIEKFFSVCGEVCEKTRENYQPEILFVDDGSKDRSPLLLDQLAKSHPELVRVLHFSRNFGHEAAMTAGKSSIRRPP